MKGLSDYHWATWSAEAAHGAEMARGFGRQSPFYTPARRGNVDVAEELYRADSDDLTLIELIEVAVRALEKHDHHAAECLKHWFGAYPGAPARRGERVSKMGINRKTAYEYVKRQQAWVDGWIRGYIQKQ